MIGSNFTINGISFTIDNIQERKYWFVRTYAGAYYNEYLNEGFIAIGFNEITDKGFIERADVDEAYKRALYERIKSSAEVEDTKTVKPGLIVNQLKRFLIEMNEGDIVLIPSENSQYITFGQIISDTFIASDVDDSDEGKCPFIKRRRVKWIKTLSKRSLDPYLFKAIYSHHIITDVSEAADYINRSLSNLYVKDDMLHMTLRVRTEDPVRLTNIKPLLYGFEEIAEVLNIPSEIKDKVKQIQLKINVQSPGPVEYIIPVVIGVFIFAVLGGVFWYRTQRALERNGGSVRFEAGYGIVSSEYHLNPPTQSEESTFDLSAEQILELIKKSPKALKTLQAMTNAIDDLNTKLPNEEEKDDQD